MGGCLHLDADWVGATRSLYDTGIAWTAWADALADRLTTLMPQRLVGLQVAHIAPGGTIARIESFSQNPDAAASLREFAPYVVEMSPETVRGFYFPRRSVLHLPEVLAALPENFKVGYRQWMKQLAVAHGFATTVHPEPGLVVTAFALSDRPVELDRRERTALRRFGLHLESSVRLRRRPEVLVAVLGPDGRVEHARDGSVPAGITAPPASGPRGADGLALWRALVAGELSAIERAEGGKRKVFLYENPPHRQPLRSLTAGEQDVVSMVGHGHTAKSIAYGLGISEPTVSTRLENAAGKIGLASRMELVRVAAMLTRDPRARFTDTKLTTAERDVLGLLAQGLSNGEIARARGRSVRTIANQVSALLSKTGAPSRKALGALPRSGE